MIVVALLYRRRKRSKSQENKNPSIELQAVVTKNDDTGPYTSIPVGIGSNNSTENSRTSTNMSKISNDFDDQIKYEDLQMIKELGSGAFGKVYLAKWKETNVAVKELKSADDNTLKVFADEIAIMKSLKPHENVIQYLGTCPSPYCLVMQYCPNGSLYTLLHTKNKMIDCTMLSEMIVGIASGMRHLAAFNVVVIPNA